MSVDEQAEVVRAFVSGVVDRFGYSAETSVRIDDDQIFIDVTGSELGLLIGPRGVTLDALQELARTVIQRRSEEHAARVTVDVAGFRAKRAEALGVFARGVANEVLSSGVAEALEPMSSADRKIVHDTINAIEGVVTTSEGADPRRYVVVRPAADALAEALRRRGPLPSRDHPWSLDSTPASARDRRDWARSPDRSHQARGRLCRRHCAYRSDPDIDPRFGFRRRSPRTGPCGTVSERHRYFARRSSESHGVSR
jgi:spoIIIJ-associated protein